LLARLANSGVDFVLVGALAAVAQGAPLTTQDVDVVHRRTPENVDRLLAFLAQVNARYRGHPAVPPLHPTREALLGPGHQLLMTDLGPIDVLGVVEGGVPQTRVHFSKGPADARDPRGDPPQSRRLAAPLLGRVPASGASWP
jgi:hypothetical protein